MQKCQFQPLPGRVVVPVSCPKGVLKLQPPAPGMRTWSTAIASTCTLTYMGMCFYSFLEIMVSPFSFYIKSRILGLNISLL